MLLDTMLEVCRNSQFQSFRNRNRLFPAHIAGLAGKHTTNGRMDKITGLDPSRKGFNINQSMTRLAGGDARFVEVYHTNGGKLGIMEHVVDSDKYFSKSKDFF